MEDRVRASGAHEANLESGFAALHFHFVTQSDLPDGLTSQIPVQPPCEKYSDSVFRNFVV
jgi:hypothetical protein